MRNEDFTQPVNAGKEVYKWQYIDEETGNLVCDRKNMQEYIQSFAGQCDYKRYFDEEGVKDNGDLIYVDTTQFGDNPATINQYFDDIARRVAEMVKTEQQPVPVSEQQPAPSGADNGGDITPITENNKGETK